MEGAGRLAFDSEGGDALVDCVQGIFYLMRISIFLPKYRSLQRGLCWAYQSGPAFRYDMVSMDAVMELRRSLRR